MKDVDGPDKPGHDGERAWFSPFPHVLVCAMSEVLGDFIRALRSADIRVSTSESIDAGNVIDLVGFDDRQTLKDALSQVLAKSDDEKQAFAETFDTYFSFEQFKERPAAANENDERERQESEEDGGDGEDGDPSQSGSASAPGGGGMSGEPQGEPLSLIHTDAADDLPCVDLGGRRIIKKKKTPSHTRHLSHLRSRPPTV